MATTTAGDLVRKALQKLLVVGKQDTIASDEMEDGLDSLNLMLDSWRLERLSLVALTTYSTALTSGQNTFTIGPGGDFNTTRPTKIENAFVRYSQADYPMWLLNQAQWDAIPYKPVGGLPRRLFYNPQYPLGQINVFPYAQDGGYTLFIDYWGEIESFANIADAFVLPPGYARAIIYNLAIELAADYNKSPSPEVYRIAKKAKEAIRTVNNTKVVANVDSALISPALKYDITSDGYV